MPFVQCPSVRVCLMSSWFVQGTGGKHQARGLKLALHLVLSGLAPCFYPAAAPSSLPLVKEQLHLCSPKITFSPLKATMRLMWPLVKMSLTPLVQGHEFGGGRPQRFSTILIVYQMISLTVFTLIAWLWCMFDRSLPHRSFPTSHSTLHSGSKSLSTTPRSVGGSIYRNQLEFSCMVDLSLLPCLFIQVFICISMDSRIFILYFGL